MAAQIMNAVRRTRPGACHGIAFRSLPLPRQVEDTEVEDTEVEDTEVEDTAAEETEAADESEGKPEA